MRGYLYTGRSTDNGSQVERPNVIGYFILFLFYFYRSESNWIFLFYYMGIRRMNQIGFQFKGLSIH
jgi:hypothetical protein